MSIRRIVPNIATTDPSMCRAFYVDFLGLQVGMDMGWIVTYVSPENPLAQITLVRGEAVPANPPLISVTIELPDVYGKYQDALTRGYEIVYPLSDEPWGVRRFGVVDPNGAVINIMRHLTPEEMKK